MDKEISAMAKVSEAMGELESDERLRVLQWAASKYEVAIRPSAQPAGSNGYAEVDEVEDAEGGVQANGSYESVADLFVDASPSTEAEKVLVAGYWLHTTQGMESFKSHDVNKQLKNLGHRVSSINKKFDSLMNQSPQLAVQLRKSGSSQQARKEYKLTKAGKDSVESMLAGDLD